MSYASQHSDLPTGPFSGVNLSCILDKTTLESEVVFEADARALEQYGSGMKFEEQDGRTVAVTEDGFSLRFKAKMSPGAHAFLLPGHGPDRKGWRHRSLRESMPRSAWTDKTGRNLVQGKQCDRNGQGHP